MFLMKVIIIIFSAIASVILAIFLSLAVAGYFKGKNYSDVGVPMYTNSDLALVVGILVYPLLGGLFLFAIDRTLNKNHLISRLFGVVVFFVSLFVYIPLLTFMVGW